MPLRDVSWEEFSGLSLDGKARALNSKGRLFHVLYAQQFGRKELDDLGALATQIRFLAKSDDGARFLLGLLPHRRAMLYFTQPSTRTFLSFCAACEVLGMSLGEVRDTSTSSEFKGESQEDSVRTFSSYFDLIVMRSKIGGLAERMAWTLSNSERPVPIINAGSGRDQHPTQALLDIYTLQRSFERRGGIDGKRIVFVGDLARGRTVRSLSCLLANYRGVRMVFVAPDQLQIGRDILEQLEARGVSYELSADFAAAIPDADAIYMTRIQDEWDKEQGESARIDTSSYCFTEADLARLGKEAVLMHPMPRRNEMAAGVDRDPRAVYWRQMRNGMWIRSALIAVQFGIAEVIRNRASETGVKVP
ncbi:MAG: aspartate carbamoyltransferase [Lentisphaerae bacterium]|nr:aspartate carbamoyltransferase [Lentisphaerota bacterium]